MAQHYHSTFDSRQEMKTTDFEVFYYEDKVLADVSMHQHPYYEVFFFLEGDVSYQLGQKTYPLTPGDICLIPPGVYHRPHFKDNANIYRRMVIWITPEYFELLAQLHPDIAYSFRYVDMMHHYHYSADFNASQIIFDKMITLMEEKSRNAPFHNSMISCYITSLLLSINRIIYHDENPDKIISDEGTLFSKVCDYINMHLDEEISLDLLAREFYVSKYHISHVFKDNMGLSVHQYLLKKRLYASKNQILAGIPLKEVAETYGFKDYANFFRAFKKEFGMGPREYKDSYKFL